jgi:Mg-chelatase subunit ChlD
MSTKYERLSKYDIEVLVDKSGSMAEKDGTGRTRWQRAEESTIALARECEKFDDDGITVGVFGDKLKVYENVKAGGDVIANMFKENEPSGGTETAGALRARLDAYFERKKSGKAKPIIIAVVTDGIPNNPDAVANVIVEATKKMDADEEIGIQFLQIGNDAGATAFLKKLDDDLVKQGAKFDIVDTKTQDEAGDMLLADLLIAALDD